MAYYPQPQGPTPYPQQYQGPPGYGGTVAAPPGGVPQGQYGGMPQGQYMNAPPPGYGGPQMAGGSTVVIVEQQGVPGSYAGNMPLNCVCPNCHANIMTQVTVSPGATSFLCCIALFLVGLWPCALVPVRLHCFLSSRAASTLPAPRLSGLTPHPPPHPPPPPLFRLPFPRPQFCMESCQDVTHSCPNCSCVIRRKPAFTD